jgi:transaldolase
MTPTQSLAELGQSLWLDNITRDMLNDGTLERYRDELSITGLTSNPTIFEQALATGNAYDAQIRRLVREGITGESLFMKLAITDLQHAADLFRPIFDQTQGRDGWVSMEVSPLLIRDPTATVRAARHIHEAASRPNLYVKIPGSVEGIPAIEETVFAGIPVNVTLLFSTAQYLAVADAYMRALERRLAAGLQPDVSSVASVFVSRWDKAVADKVPETLRNKLGIASAHQTYQAYWDLMNSQRWRSLESEGARPQRLLWASTATKDPKAPMDLYVSALAAPNTVNTMPEKTLLAYAKDGVQNGGIFSSGVDSAGVISDISKLGVDIDALAVQLQDEGGKSFVKSWKSLMDRIAEQEQSLEERTA